MGEDRKIVYLVFFIFSFFATIYGIFQLAGAADDDTTLAVLAYCVFLVPCFVLLLIAIFLRFASTKRALIASLVLSILSLLIWTIPYIGTIETTHTPAILIGLFELLNVVTVLMFWRSNQLRIGK